MDISLIFRMAEGFAFARGTRGGGGGEPYEWAIK